MAVVCGGLQNEVLGHAHSEYMTTRSRPLLFTMVTAVALLLAACGGPDDIFEAAADAAGTESNVDEVVVSEQDSTSRSEPDDAADDVGDAGAAVEGLGKAAATIGDGRYSFEGECMVRSDGGEFTMPNAGLTESRAAFSVEVRDGQNYVLADFTLNAGEGEFTQWGILQQDEAGNPPEIRIDPNGINISGFLMGLTDRTTQPFVISMACGN